MSYDLMEKMASLTKYLDAAIREIGRRGEIFANAKCEYQVELAKEMLSLREKGQPVTLVPDLARGTPRIAKLRLQKDLSEALYKAAQEAIQSYKLQIRVLDAQIAREWGKPNDQ